MESHNIKCTVKENGMFAANKYGAEKLVKNKSKLKIIQNRYPIYMTFFVRVMESHLKYLVLNFLSVFLVNSHFHVTLHFDCFLISCYYRA